MLEHPEINFVGDYIFATVEPWIAMKQEASDSSFYSCLSIRISYKVTRGLQVYCEVGERVVEKIQRERDRETRKVLLAFAKSIQERDIVTYEHSRRVATYAQRLARYLGWSRRDARDLALAALVHDLGKTWIANDILNKSAALSEEERRKMERHSVIGARILIGCDVQPFYVEAVLCHHEAWNGRGYPANLQKEEIPLSARILSVADVYDVLTSQRPYKAPLTKDAARDRLLQGSGTSFDPIVVKAFVSLLDTNANFTLSQQIYGIPAVMPRKGTGPLPSSRYL